MRVLIVEDSEDIASLFGFLLERHGVDVITWTEDFPQLPAGVDWSTVDAVLCDQFLAGYDGKELMWWLAEHHPDVRRVMLTADAMVEAEESGADVLLRKPADTDQLFTALGVDHER